MARAVTNARCAGRIYQFAPKRFFGFRSDDGSKRWILIGERLVVGRDHQMGPIFGGIKLM